jgi:succinate dehydrogenase/fumarate reductase flavoprotein subunit
MAGLCAAARARQLGAAPVVLEKGERAGGSMLLSSGVVWRYASFDEFRAECPTGDPALQRAIHDRLDDALDWLESLGAPVLERETANPRTTGRRFDTRGLTDVLARAAGDVRPRSPLPADTEPPLILATGGFGARLAREWGLPLRANPWSEGDGLDFARARRAALSAGQEEFYGRALPDAPVAEADLVRLSQLYGRVANVLDERGEPFFTEPVDWSENNLVQAIARRPGGAAWYVLDEAALGARTPYGTVREAVEAARAAGGTVVEPAELPFPLPDTAVVAVRVRAAVTHTIGGLLVDATARVLDGRREPVPGLYAAGVDAGGWSTGGYASGLATALVLGVTAAESLVDGL